MADIQKLEKELWEAADNLRANSKLTSQQYCMPVLGLIFLRYAWGRFKMADAQIKESRAQATGRQIPIEAADYTKRGAMFIPEESRYDRELLQHTVGPDGALADAGLDRGHQLVAFVTRGCPYCRMTREKLTSIARRNHLDTTRIHYYEPADLPDNLFLRITYGQRPFVVLLDEGVPTVTYHYRNISERQLSRFLKQ